MPRSIVRSSSQKTGLRGWSQRWTLLSMIGPIRPATVCAASGMRMMLAERTFYLSSHSHREMRGATWSLRSSVAEAGLP